MFRCDDMHDADTEMLTSSKTKFLSRLDSREMHANSRPELGTAQKGPKMFLAAPDADDR